VIYGSTEFGGRLNPNNFGTVFALNASERVLHKFAGKPDGANPYAALTADASGALYGTAQFGGKTNAGRVFRSTP
jgi:uncharacterized repeat protein (TIGR03803 family)